ncbi:MAG: fused MFS/spermidine synthase [Nannocystaceae bacterium]|nr:fused MFS/spermidine synthase [bacterium]
MLYVFALLAGIAGLTWELLWMHYSSLSLGVSAQGAALTLVAFSVGMGVGSFAAGRWLRDREADLLRVWGGLEVGIGLLGQALAPGFGLLAGWDAQLYGSAPGLAQWVHGFGVLLLLAVPSACMGATFPVFAALGWRYGVSLSLMYACNIAGASVGIVLATFVLIPRGGIEATVGLASSIGLGLGAALLIKAMREAKRATSEATEVSDADASTAPARVSPGQALVVVGATGFGTFCLEVSWFRSLRAAFQATTESFALVMFAVLLALAAGSALARRLLRARRQWLGFVLAAAAFAVLVSTPFVERLDRVVVEMPAAQNFAWFVARRHAVSLVALGPSMLLIGVGLPYCLEAVGSAHAVGRLYAVNTAAAVLGSLAAAWVLLPTIGASHTAWVAALALAAASWTTLAPRRRPVAMLGVAAGLAVAWVFASDVGELRVQTNRRIPHVVLATREGPDATVSVIEHPDRSRYLVIDGFYATGTGLGAHYMPWMGHLPMLMHPNPERALVICFGTGQTANAVRQEQPQRLDIVDVSESVFAMADHFPQNEGVLDDPRVHHHVMDGRAWLRRTSDRYDVVTLEPMPPTFAGTNALYSVEFYRLVEQRLEDDGVVAQWLPFHLVDPQESAAIVGAFIEVFPDAFLWFDPTGTGILVGRKEERSGAGLWPGLSRPIARDMSPEEVRRAMRYGPRFLAAYATLADPVTDDNQRLSYGYGRTAWWNVAGADTTRYHHLMLEAIAQGGSVDDNLRAFFERYPSPSAVPVAQD